MRPLILFLYRWLLLAKRSYRLLPDRFSRRSSAKGFTLIELLVSLIISSIVVTGLLTVVVEITTIDRREDNLNQVQRDMNRAMEYITDDLKEAVYVYPDPQTVAVQLTADPSFPGGTGEVPVLAFWRIDPLESLPDCTTGSTAFQAECSLLEIRQSAYTLVVYAQKVNDGNQNWSGQSRIIRYELSKYSDLTNLTWRSGYRDPTDPDDALATFETWQNNGNPSGSSAVLIDYVQAPSFTPPVALYRAPLSDTGGACRAYGLDDNNNPLYDVVPTTATTTNNNSFFACVRNPAINGVVTSRGNQDVYVFLRGNVQGVTGGVRGYSDETSLPILETQVLVKGVVNKNAGD